MKKRIKIVFMLFLCLLVVSAISCYGRADAKSKNGISSIKFLDREVIRIKFPKAKKLSKKNIKIFFKEKKNAKYGKNCDIQKIEKVNSRTYYIILKRNYTNGVYTNTLSYGDFIRIKIGNASVETICFADNKPPTVYFTGVKNKHKSIMVDFEGYVKGKCKYRISKLPKGIKAKKSSACVWLSGKPKAVLNGKKVTITATDSYGRKVKNEVLFYVGSPTKVVTYAYNADNKTVLSGNKQKEQINIASVGGSGKYSYKKTNKVSGVAYNGDVSSDYFEVSDNISPGKHIIKYSATDSKGHKASSTIKFNVKKAVKLTVSLKTADNKNIGNQDIELSEYDFNNKYLYLYPYYIKNNGDSSTAYVAPDMLYRIETDMSKEFQYCRTAKKDKKYKVKTSMYKISLKTPDNSSLDTVKWELDGSNEKSGKIGSGSVLYLEKGTYDILGERAYNIYNASFKADKSKSVTVDVFALSDTGNLTESKKQYVKVSLKGNVYTFTPSETSTYTFWAEDLGEDQDVDISMYNESSMDDHDIILNARIYRGGTYKVNLTAGHQYFIRVKTPNDYNDGIAILVRFDKAPEIPAEKKISVTLKSDKIKYLVFKPTVTSYYTINLYGADKDENPVWMSMSDDNNKIVLQNTNGDSGSFKLNKKLSAGNTYYIELFTEINTKVKIKIHRNGNKN